MIPTRSLALALVLLGAPVLSAQTHSITVNSASTFTVPSGVTTLTVEGWGGGGGGAYTGGGSGGAYFRIVLSVTSGATLSFTVGSGGAGGTSGSFGATGGATTMTYKSGATTITCTANGGAGSQFFPGSSPFSCTGPATNGIPLAYNGSAGHYGDVPRTIAIGPRSATNYTASVFGGDGGDAGNAVGTHGKGNAQTYAYLINTNVASGSGPSNDPVQGNVSNNTSQASPGIAPGGGGGGTASVADANLPGAAGGAGQALVTY